MIFFACLSALTIDFIKFPSLPNGNANICDTFCGAEQGIQKFDLEGMCHEPDWLMQYNRLFCLEQNKRLRLNFYGSKNS